MDACGSGARWNSSHIKDEVPDLPVKQIGRSETQDTACLVLIAIDESKSAEPWCSFKRRGTIWVPDDLCIVVINN